MNDDEFEWDDAKRGITFAMVRDVFSDPFAIEQSDDRFDYGEERWSILGMADNRLVLVAYTLRRERIRIISARLAEPHERREYHEQNARDDET
jgi:uncharacterized protein